MGGCFSKSGDFGLLSKKYSLLRRGNTVNLIRKVQQIQLVRIKRYRKYSLIRKTVQNLKKYSLLSLFNGKYSLLKGVGGCVGVSNGRHHLIKFVFTFFSLYYPYV